MTINYTSELKCCFNNSVAEVEEEGSGEDTTLQDIKSSVVSTRVTSESTVSTTTLEAGNLKYLNKARSFSALSTYDVHPDPPLITHEDSKCFLLKENMCDSFDSSDM